MLSDTQKHNQKTAHTLTQNKKHFKKPFLKLAYAQKRAGSSAWYECLIRNQEAAGPNPARSTLLFESFPEESLQLH
jgi:GTP cyclohydrolase FolE2